MSKSIANPLAKLQSNKKKFFNDIIQDVKEELKKLYDNDYKLKQILGVTIDFEIRRLKKNKHEFSNGLDLEFWENLLTKLGSLESNELNEVVNKIIFNYLKEINRDVSPKLSKIFIKIIGNLFIAFFTKEKFNFNKLSTKLKKSVIYTGEFETLKKLKKIGTLVFVPTHSSHIDSALIGFLSYVIDSVFPIFGAGLNLYRNKIFSFFSTKIGTYTIDRMKKNFFYIQSVKSYSKYLIKNNTNTVFYPGGGRSRSGAVESKLKLGLLTTVIDAQIENIKDKGSKFKKIFIVPISLSYDNIIEAPTLIRQNLGLKSKKQTISQYFKFLLKFFKSSCNFAISVGMPIDVLGNRVDDDGQSIDTNGNKINLFETIKKNNYFKKTEVPIKNIETTILSQYKNYNYIFLSHFISYIVFELFKNKYYNEYQDSTLWDFSPSKFLVDINEVLKKGEKLIKYIKENKIKIILDPKVYELTDRSTVETAIKDLGNLHDDKPLYMDNGNFKSEDFITLYYYHNKMDGYGLDECFKQ